MTNMNGDNLSFDITGFTKRFYLYPRQSVSSIMAALVTLLRNTSRNVDYNLSYRTKCQKTNAIQITHLYGLFYFRV